MPVDVEHERMLGVEARDRPQPVRREELVLVEEPREEPEHAVDTDDAEQDAGARPSAAAEPGCARR